MYYYKNVIQFILVLTLFILMFSCSKEENQESGKTYPNTIIIGDSTDMNVISYKSHQGGQFDIDTDGKTDFSMVHISDGQTAFISSLLIEFEGYVGCIAHFNTDTLYRYLDTTVQNPFPHTSCIKSPGNIILQTPTNEITMQDFTIGNQLFSSDEYVFGESFRLLGDITAFQGGCYFVYNEPAYIGIKMNNMNSTRLGWIKLTLFRDHSYTIHETAIQE